MEAVALAQSEDTDGTHSSASAEKGGRGSIVLRLLSALVLIPSALLVVAAGGWLFTAWVALAAVLMAHEWLRLVGAGRCWWLGLPLAGTALAGPVALTASAPSTGFGLLLLGGVTAGLVAAARGKDGFWILLGAAYVTVPAIATVWLRAQGQGLDLLLYLFVVVWVTDSGAYFAGRLIGGPAFAPHISPNKTWAGVIGGVLLATIGGLGAAHGLFGAGLPGGPAWAQILSLTLLLSVVTQAGDIFESALKRHFGFKDTGALIPGHGGVLDRLDGFLFAVMMLALAQVLGCGPV